MESQHLFDLINDLKKENASSDFIVDEILKAVVNDIWPNVELINTKADNYTEKQKSIRNYINTDSLKIINYIKNNQGGHAEFRLVLRNDGTGYINLMGKSSETIDFEIDKL